MSERTKRFEGPPGRVRIALWHVCMWGAVIGGALAADEIGERFFPDDEAAQGSLIFPAVLVAVVIMWWGLNKTGIMEWAEPERAETERSKLASARRVERWPALLPMRFWFALIIAVAFLPTILGWFTALRMDDPWHDRAGWISAAYGALLFAILMWVDDLRANRPTRRAYIEDHRDDGQVDIRYDHMIVAGTIWVLIQLGGAWLVVTVEENPIAGTLLGLAAAVSGIITVSLWLESRRYKAWQCGGDNSRSVFAEK